MVAVTAATSATGGGHAIVVEPNNRGRLIGEGPKRGDERRLNEDVVPVKEQPERGERVGAARDANGLAARRGLAASITR